MSNVVPENMVHDSPEKRKELVLHATQWSTADYPAVHNQTQPQEQSAAAPAVMGDEGDDEEDDARAEKTKKSPMAAQNQYQLKTSNDETPAGHFLYPLVAVDCITDWSTAAPTETKKSQPRLPWPPPLESNDHHSPALRWSLLLHITELRKHGLEVGESIYSKLYLVCRNKKGMNLLGNDTQKW
jgi:hypothetical protein